MITTKLNTSPPLDQGWIALARNRFAFQFGGCSDGAEMLVCESESVTDKNCYSFTFTSTELTVRVLDSSGNEAITETFGATEIFSCNNYANWLWVSWRDHVLSFGKGEAIGENIVGEVAIELSAYVRNQITKSSMLLHLFKPVLFSSFRC